MYRVSPFVRHFGLALLSGAGLATLWVNSDPASYYDAIEYRLADLPQWLAPGGYSLTPLSLVSDGLMALFTAFVAKELWEALALERGALSGRRARVPLAAVIGGTLGAVLTWVLVGQLIETAAEASFAVGWQVPVGSDVVLGYLVGRRVFGPGHPALHLLLLTAIGFDILGLLLLGITDPAGSALRLLWLALPLAAALAVRRIFGQRATPAASERDRRRAMQLWPYVLAGIVSYAGVAASGLPPALGLLPVIPAIPHADRAFGLFAEAEEFLHDPLNRLAHLLVRPLAGVLFLFGLTRGGIDLAAFAPATLTTLSAFWLGKPLGVIAGFIVALGFLRTDLPAGITGRDLVLTAGLLGMGFTVPVIALETALPGGGMTEAARLGLALSLLAGPGALAAARLLRRQN